MSIFYSILTQQTPGPEVTIDCPSCKDKEAVADSRTHVETLKLFFVLPLFTNRNTVLVCRSCNVDLITRLTIEQLHDKSAEQINRTIVPKSGGLLVGILFLVALFFCWIPLFNLVIAATVPVANYQARGANKLAGYIPLVVALGFNIWMLIAVLGA